MTHKEFVSAVLTSTGYDDSSRFKNVRLFFSKGEEFTYVDIWYVDGDYSRSTLDLNGWIPRCAASVESLSKEITSMADDPLDFLTKNLRGEIDFQYICDKIRVLDDEGFLKALSRIFSRIGMSSRFSSWLCIWSLHCGRPGAEVLAKNVLAGMELI